MLFCPSTADEAPAPQSVIEDADVGHGLLPLPQPLALLVTPRVPVGTKCSPGSHLPANGAEELHGEVAIEGDGALLVVGSGVVLTGVLDVEFVASHVPVQLSADAASELHTHVPSQLLPAGQPQRLVVVLLLVVVVRAHVVCPLQVSLTLFMVVPPEETQ